MIAQLKEYLSQCPALDGLKIRINYLGGESGACSLEMVSTQTVVKEYADGGMLCGRDFVFAIRQEYSEADISNRVAAERCQQVENWIREQNDTGNLPQIGQGINPLSIEVAKSFSIASVNSVDARYEMQLRLIYYKQ